MEQDLVDDPVSVYLAEVCKVAPLNREEELGCIRKIRARAGECETAERRLVEANLSLVVAIARQHKDGNMNILDLIIKGNEGLLDALRSLESGDQDDFTALASGHVERAILGAITGAGL